MKLVRTKAELLTARNEFTGDTALVMTMGALHEGHLSLVRQARKLAQNVVVSIYVNPLQFGPGEDFEAYPRQLEADLALLSELAVDLVFAPSDEEMYPRTPLVSINPGPVAKVLEGKTRPGHFAGVLQVVHKVIQLVRPEYAIFGEKDAQQLALIKSMVSDLDMPVEIIPLPIQRDTDGLALSSRNTYLSEKEREIALELSASLRLGADAVAQARLTGIKLRGPELREKVAAALGAQEQLQVDYVEVVERDTFLIAGRDYCGPALIVLAAWVGTTRLIDNMEVEIG